MTVHANRQPIDLFEAARPVRKEWLPRDVRTGLDEVVLPRRSVLLARNIGERVETVFGFNLDLIYSPVGGIPALVAEGAVAGEISVWLTIQLFRICFQRMRRKLFNIDRGGCGQTLRA